MGGFFCGWTGSRCGPATHAASGETARGGFCLGDSFHALERSFGGRAADTHAAAGAEPRMPPHEEGLGGIGGLRLDFWVDHGVVRHAASGETARGGFCLILLRLDWEPLRKHGLTTGVVRHACRLHEEVFVWGILLRLDWEPLREHGLAGGPASHACRRGSGSTRGFFLAARGGGAVAFSFTVDRQYEGFLIYAHPPPPRKKTRRSRDKSQDRRALLSP